MRGLVLAAALCCAACATPRPFDRQLADGHYADAARAFENDSTLWARPEALLQAGRLYADPALPTYDAGRARAALDRLVRNFPGSGEALAAAPLLGVLGELDRVTGEMDRMRGEMKALTDTLAASREAAERDLQVMKRKIEQLEKDLAEARTELERLKAIDLRPRPDVRR